MKIVLSVVVVLVVVLSVVAAICLYHFIGISKCVGDKEYEFRTEEISTSYDGISLYGKALIPVDDSRQKFTTVIYAHGADSNYKSDMTTLKSLAKSGIAVYTFDFYGWTDKSTGPKGTKWFKGTAKEENDAYVEKLFQQVDDLNAVIEKVKSLDFVDSDNLYLLGSSMGGVTVATCAVNHSDDIRGIILQYPAMVLNEDKYDSSSQYDVNRYRNKVLILQGNADKIVDESSSQTLCEYYNSDHADKAEIIIYDGQPHVFTGRYKVIAAGDIYKFINN